VSFESHATVFKNWLEHHTLGGKSRWATISSHQTVTSNRLEASVCLQVIAGRRNQQR